MRDIESGTIDQLARKLQPHYSHFDVANRLLFTGHSHQAWPDVALEGLKEAYQAAAAEVDKKWETAFEKTEILRSYLRDYYDDPEGLYCQGENTHQLLVSWLSSFDLAQKPKIITTDGEFHSMHRQLNRLGEEGVEIVHVRADSENITGRIEEEADERTAAIMLSRVYFESGLVNTRIHEIAEVARSAAVPFLIDDYHGTNVVPLSIREQNLDDCFLLIGGYKYLQWGEGNCFLRFPKECSLRPVVTGWFASFSSLDKPRGERPAEEPVPYDEGNRRFATGTYDPSSQFRAARVAEFFREQGLTPEVLHNQYQRQVEMLRGLFLERDFDSGSIRLLHTEPLSRNGGFLSLVSPKARELRSHLLERGVFTDARGEILRLGPAPYTTTAQIEQCMEELARALRDLS